MKRTLTQLARGAVSCGAVSCGTLCCALVAAVWCGGNTSAATLYTLNVTGPGNLLRVDPATGATSSVAPDVAPAAGSWTGLTTSPSEANIVFGINNPRPATFSDPQLSRLAKIDVLTGTARLLPFFDSAVLGYENVFSSAVAISPRQPDLAILAGADRSIPPNRIIWRVDTTTGQALGSATRLQDSAHLESLTFGPDGETLFGTDNLGRLVTVDPDTGAIASRGDPGLSNFLSGLAFRPGDDTLFAIDAFRSDRLVVLDPETGALVADVGPLGIGGPEGLAFVPEPSAAYLALLGLLMIYRRGLRSRLRS